MSIALSALVEELKKRVEELERDRQADRARLEVLEGKRDTLRLPEKRRA